MSQKVIWKKLLFFIGAGLCFACSHNVEPIPKRELSFYYWKTSLEFKTEDRHRLSSLGIDRLYVRLFDVTEDPSGYPQPTNPIRLDKNSLANFNVVPVVFLTQAAIDQIDEAHIAGFADDMFSHIQARLKALEGINVSEWQLDCDWTSRSRGKYFRLLKLLKTKLSSLPKPVALSCTIRLHQLQDKNRVGIPPCDKGVLMIYHTDSPMKFSSKSAILNPATAVTYLKSLPEYDLSLDLALPIFEWVVQFNSQKKFVRILGAVKPSSLERIASEESPNIWIAEKDGYLLKNRIMEGDILKLDKTDISSVMKVMRAIAEMEAVPDARVIIYHYDREMLDQFAQGNDQNLRRLVGGN